MHWPFRRNTRQYSSTLVTTLIPSTVRCKHEIEPRPSSGVGGLRLLKRPFSKGEKATCRLLACAALAAGLGCLGSLQRGEILSKETILGILTWCIPYVAVVWMMILSARKLDPEEATTVALLAAWLPNAIYCAISFWRGWQIGAYLAAFTIVLYTVEITLFMRRKRQTLGPPLTNPS